MPCRLCLRDAALPEGGLGGQTEPAFSRCRQLSHLAVVALVVRKSRAALPSLPALTLGVAEVVLHGIGGTILRGREGERAACALWEGSERERDWREIVRASAA
jgi:hypothetical protein